MHYSCSCIIRRSELLSPVIASIVHAYFLFVGSRQSYVERIRRKTFVAWDTTTKSFSCVSIYCHYGTISQVVRTCSPEWFYKCCILFAFLLFLAYTTVQKRAAFFSLDTSHQINMRKYFFQVRCEEPSCPCNKCHDVTCQIHRKQQCVPHYEPIWIKTMTSIKRFLIDTVCLWLMFGGDVHTALNRKMNVLRGKSQVPVNIGLLLADSLRHLR